MKDEKIFEHISQDDAAKIAAVIAGDEASVEICSDSNEIRLDERIDGTESCDCTDTLKNKQQQSTDEKEAKENVKNTRSEESIEDDNKHIFGKFKNPQELLKAYGELEKEFTRRSQRLKELENGNRNLPSKEDWKVTVDKFFEEIPAAKSFAKDIANEIIKNPELKEDVNCLNVALVRVLADKFRTPEQLMQDGQFLNDYVLSSERVRDAIIADYLESVRDGMPPHMLHSGGMQCVAPKVKPKTIEEAGFMFLKNNK